MILFGKRGKNPVARGCKKGGSNEWAIADGYKGWDVLSGVEVVANTITKKIRSHSL